MGEGQTVSNLGLPDQVNLCLDDFVQSAREILGDDLRSIVLYGSAAEKRLRATSDVNLIIILNNFSQQKADLLREPLRVAHAAIKLDVMFILEGELQEAADCFAVKFADISRRRIVLFGTDCIEHITISQQAIVTRLRQTLLNLILRLRSSYVLRGLREEQLSLAIAESAGPLRSTAATLLNLEEGLSLPPKESLEQVALADSPQKWKSTLATISQAREDRFLPPGEAEKTFFELLDLAHLLLERVNKLSG